MTESLLLVICEGGLFPYQALARAGSCNRSLYAVCEKLLRPAVESKRGRLFLEIINARKAELLENEHRDLARLRRMWELQYPISWLYNCRRIMFGNGFCDYQINEAQFAKGDCLFSLRVWAGVGPCELHTYSPETLRQWRELTAKQVCYRNHFTRGYTRPWQ